jgi:ketosteroid isomerase-like protein
LVFVVVSASASLGQTSGTGQVEGGILAADAAWLKVYAAKDLDKSVAFCDEQVSMLVANVPIATGKDAVRKAIADDFASGDLIWHANKAGVASSGPVGTYDLKMKSASGKTVLDKGKYLPVWKKHADGTWKVLFNSDLPCVPNPPARVLAARRRAYFNFANSALTSFKMGMSGSASFQSVRKS